MDDQYIHGVLNRVIAVEIKLESALDRLDGLLDTVNERLRIYEGDANTPNLISRVIALEEFQTAIKWSIGIIYTSIIGAAMYALKDRISK